MKKLALTALSIASLSLPAAATDFDFFGSFTKDDDVARFYFSVGSASTVTVFSSSWDDGGFDPILAIWDSAGDLLYQQDDGGLTGSETSNAVSYDYGVWDSYYTVSLPAGSYSATIAQFDNFFDHGVGANISLGFRHSGNPNFTFDEGYGTAPFFNGVQSSTDTRTGTFAFHILNVDSASGGVVPDASSSLALLSLAFAGLGWARRQTRS